MSDVPAVAVRGLTKRYGDVAALDDVALTVGAGAVHGLLGPNGAGKTTLLRILLGLVRPDAGDVRLFGRRREEAGQGVLSGVGGFVEAPRCYPYLSGLRNLELLARLDAKPGSSCGPGPSSGTGPSPHEALDRVGLSGQTGRVGGWSLGMRQRLGLAAALLRGSRLLVLDEPANGLDPAGARELRALLADLARAGRTILLSSHDMAEVGQLCDSVTVVRAGTVAFDGPLAALRARAPDPYAVLSTSDDAAAATVAGVSAGVVVVGRTADGLRVRATTDRLDELVHALSRAGVAVRGLHREHTPLEELVQGLLASPAAAR